MRPTSLIVLIVGVVSYERGAHAQVLSIGDGGRVTVLAGPAVTTRDGVTPIVPAAPIPDADSRVDREITTAAARYGIDRRLVRAVAVQESGLRQEARSPKGAVGVMQLTAVTARSLGVNAADLAGDVQGGAAYLAQMLRRFDGDVQLALAAYNAGPTAVVRYRAVPPFLETQAYVRGVLARLSATAVASPPLGAVP